MYVIRNVLFSSMILSNLNNKQIIISDVGVMDMLLIVLTMIRKTILPIRFMCGPKRGVCANTELLDQTVSAVCLTTGTGHGREQRLRTPMNACVSGFSQYVGVIYETTSCQQFSPELVTECPTSLLDHKSGRAAPILD